MNIIDSKYFKTQLTGIPRKYLKANFDELVVDNENKEKIEFLKKYDLSKSLFLSGNVGTGKTHIAVSIMNNLKPVWLKYQDEADDQYAFYSENIDYRERELGQQIIEAKYYKYRPAKALFVDMTKFLRRYKDSFVNQESREDMINSITKEAVVKTNKWDKTYVGGYDLIVLDDFGVGKITESDVSALFSVMNEFYHNGNKFIITSNLSIQEIELIDPRLASRIGGIAKIINFKGQDYRI